MPTVGFVAANRLIQNSREYDGKPITIFSRKSCQLFTNNAPPPPTQNCIYIHDFPWSNGCQVNQIDCNGSEFKSTPQRYLSGVGSIHRKSPNLSIVKIKLVKIYSHVYLCLHLNPKFKIVWINLHKFKCQYTLAWNNLFSTHKNLCYNNLKSSEKYIFRLFFKPKLYQFKWLKSVELVGWFYNVSTLVGFNVTISFFLLVNLHSL